VVDKGLQASRHKRKEPPAGGSEITERTRQDPDRPGFSSTLLIAARILTLLLPARLVLLGLSRLRLAMTLFILARLVRVAALLLIAARIVLRLLLVLPGLAALLSGIPGLVCHELSPD
jgi:hypothetical protein